MLGSSVAGTGRGRGSARAEIGLDTDRAGDLVAFTHTDAWFEYRWWSDFAEAPSWAWEVDIHRKPGYDPTEMFYNLPERRIRADEPNLIRGSHGTISDDEDTWPVLLGLPKVTGTVPATDIAQLVFT